MRRNASGRLPRSSSLAGGRLLPRGCPFVPLRSSGLRATAMVYHGLCGLSSAPRGRFLSEFESSCHTSSRERGRSPMHSESPLNRTADSEHCGTPLTPQIFRFGPHGMSPTLGRSRADLLTSDYNPRADADDRLHHRADAGDDRAQQLRIAAAFDAVERAATQRLAPCARGGAALRLRLVGDRRGRELAVLDG